MTFQVLNYTLHHRCGDSGKLFRSAHQQAVVAKVVDEPGHTVGGPIDQLDGVVGEGRDPRGTRFIETKVDVFLGLIEVKVVQVVAPLDPLQQGKKSWMFEFLQQRCVSK